MDYARAVVEFFVEKRSKGTAISAADEHLLLSWEDDGIPASVVFAGIDRAFERKSEAPKSLSDCSRWVKAAYKKWAGGAELEAAAHSVDADDGSTPDAGAASPATPSRSALDEALDELRRRCESGAPALRDATRAVLSELETLGRSGKVGPEVLAVIDEAIAEGALQRLDAAERRRIEEAADAWLRGRSMSGAAWAAARAREIIRSLES